MAVTELIGVQSFWGGVVPLVLISVRMDCDILAKPYGAICVFICVLIEISYVTHT